MKNIIKTWILLSVIMLSFTQGNAHKGMDIQMNKHSPSCHSKAVSIEKNDVCDYVCSLVFLHNNKVSLDALSFNSLNITFSNNFDSLITFQPFKPPIQTL